MAVTSRFTRGVPSWRVARIRPSCAVSAAGASGHCSDFSGRTDGRRQGWRSGARPGMLTPEQSTSLSFTDRFLTVAVTPPTIPDFSRPDGLVTAVAQDVATGEVLMVAWMNARRTPRRSPAVGPSTSAAAAASSGERARRAAMCRSSARFASIATPTPCCSRSTRSAAPCHEGYASCFFREVTTDGLEIIAERVFDPATVYGKPPS